VARILRNEGEKGNVSELGGKIAILRLGEIEEVMKHTIDGD
jgi:hypothetical protein